MALRDPFQQKLPPHWWTFASEIHPDKPVNGPLYVLALVSACFGGASHGVAMAVRKFYGGGHQGYWLQWRWWVGVLLDGFSGFLIWPAMPLVPVEFLIPLVIVMQLGSSYTLGYIVFKEELNRHGNFGILFSGVGVAGLSLSSMRSPPPWNFDMFLKSWITPRFLLASTICIWVLAATRLLLHKSVFSALTAGLLEGLQYLCSRSISAAVYDKVPITNIAYFLATAIKGICIVLIIHFQQLGLESELSRFAGIYLVSSMLFMCTYGAAFFGDELDVLSPAFIVSAITTLTGIWLLNEGIGRTARAELVVGSVRTNFHGGEGDEAAENIAERRNGGGEQELVTANWGPNQAKD